MIALPRETRRTLKKAMRRRGIAFDWWWLHDESKQEEIKKFLRGPSKNQLKNARKKRRKR